MQHRDSESSGTEPIRAAEYVRMSTEHQQYSTENQSTTIRRYAEVHGMQIVRSYADLGKSGLTLENRDGLQQLLHDAESGAADFCAVLVYDVSRWGRFQDTDESAYYEYRCRRAKVAVHYCAEPFENDGSASSSLLKTIKRTMAGEYSRELSAKVFAGKTRLAELGFRQDGTAGLGFRRLLIDQHGNPKGLLRIRERKSIFTDRVVLVLGPDEEVEAVREIYRWLIEGNETLEAIARRLNARGILNEFGRPWTRSMVKEIVTNPKYLGANVSNRTSYKLSRRSVKNPSYMWVRKDGAFPAIIDQATFEKAQEVLHARRAIPTEEELLDRLRQALQREGALSADVIHRSPGLRSRTTYSARFGGLLQAYRRIGYEPPDNYDFIEVNERLQLLHDVLIENLAASLRVAGAVVRATGDPNVLAVNEDVTLRFMLMRCRHTKHRGDRWIIFLWARERADVSIFARMNSANDAVLDYYVFPRSVPLPKYLDVGMTNSVFIDVHRFLDLSGIINLFRCVDIGGATHA